MDVQLEGADASLNPEPVPTDSEEEVEHVQAEDSESEAESPPADEENVEEKTDSFQERIDRITRFRREAEREAEALRQERDRTAKELAELRSQVESFHQSSQDKTLADFDYNEAEYAKYLREQAVTQARTEAQKEAKRIAEEYRQQQEAEIRNREFAKRASEFAKEKSDYFEVTSDPNLPFTQHMAELIQDSDIGPQVAYYLARHPDEAYDISRATPSAQGRLIGKLESKLSQAIEAEKKKQSKAPPPPKGKVKGVEPGFKTDPTDPTSDKMSDKEWLARREAQIAKKNG